MSSYNPPTDNLSEFNTAKFISSDSLSLDLTDSRYLRLSGGTLTGGLTGTTISSTSIVNSGKLAVGTTTADLQCEINHTTGQCLRLTYNDANGSASAYSNLTTTGTGSLALNSSSNKVCINGFSGDGILNVDYDADIKTGSNFNTLAQFQGHDAYMQVLVSLAGSQVVLSSEDGVAQLGLSASGSHNPQFTLNPNGYINIGADYTSSYPLSITTSANVDIPNFGYLNASGSVGTAATGTANAYSLYTSARIACTGEVNCISDRRRKKEINNITLEYCKDFVEKVEPINYKYKHIENDKINHGYIAQDVYKAGFKDLVGIIHNSDMEEEIDADGFRNPKGSQFTIISGEIIPILHKVIKDLMIRIEKLESSNP